MAHQPLQETATAHRPLPETAMAHQHLLHYRLTDLKQVTIQLVLQRLTVILLQVPMIILQFKFRAAMALVVHLHLQHTRDLTIRHLLARHNLLHQTLTMVLVNLTKKLMAPPPVVQLLLLPFLPLIPITHPQKDLLILLLTHMVHNMVR